MGHRGQEAFLPKKGCPAYLSYTICVCVPMLCDDGKKTKRRARWGKGRGARLTSIIIATTPSDDVDAQTSSITATAIII